MGKRASYVLMHGEKSVVLIKSDGDCEIYEPQFMPYDLYLEELQEEDLELRLQNLENFQHWCASRVLTLDRKYAKEILNSIGASQAATDRERAGIALSYHCLSLLDIYWTKEQEESVTFKEINLYENHLVSAFVDVSLRGKQITVENSELIAEDLNTPGCFPKAWLRKKDGFWLLKDGKKDAVERELLASKICRCFQVNQVYYEPEEFEEELVSVSPLITSLSHSIVSMEAYDIYCCNQEKNRMEEVLRLDGYSYYMMNIIDYLVGNTDRHWGNWGLLMDNATNQPLRLHDLMDFNCAFLSYDTIDGANCLTADKKMTQREAAEYAVKQVGLNQVAEIDDSWFQNEGQKQMFYQRLALLR